MNTRLTLSERLEQMPFLRMLIPLVLGVVAAEYLSFPLDLLIGTLLATLLALWIFRGERLRVTLITLLIFVLGITAAKVLNPYEEMPRHERLVLTGEVTDNVTTRERWHRTTARITAFRLYDDSTAAWQSCRENISLYVDTTYHVALGERISAVAYVNALDTLDGTSGYARTMRSRGILGRAYVIDGRLISSEMTAPATLWERVMRASKGVQQAMVARLEQVGMAEQELGVAMAVLTGDRHLLTGDLREDYSRSGISHILAISGLHLGILFLLLNYLFTSFVFLRYGRAIRTVTIILLLWGYAFISGMSASVLRAAFMLSVMQLSMMTVWSYNSYNALFASAFVLILLRPTFIYDLSFQMSYLALFSILFFFPRISRWLGVSRVERWIYLQKQRSSGIFYLFWLILSNVFTFMTGAILIGLAAQIAVAPLVGYIFGRIPFVSLLINPFVMLMITWIMLVGFIYIALGAIPWLAWIGDILNFMLRVQNGVVEWTGSLQWASLEQVSFSGNVLSLIYLMLLLLMVWIKFIEQRRRQPTTPHVLFNGG